MMRKDEVVSFGGRPVEARVRGARAAIYLNLTAKGKTLLETQTRRPGPVIAKEKTARP
jgi:hypothetical protein